MPDPKAGTADPWPSPKGELVRWVKVGRDPHKDLEIPQRLPHGEGEKEEVVAGPWGTPGDPAVEGLLRRLSPGGGQIRPGLDAGRAARSATGMETPSAPDPIKPLLWRKFPMMRVRVKSV